MNETLRTGAALVSGLLLGGIFFGGLWWTVRKGLTSKQPVLLFFGSALLRIGVVLAGFYFISSGQWESLLSCLLGFFMARFIVRRLIQVERRPVVFSRGEEFASQSR